jgi:hypothetical protein
LNLEPFEPHEWDGALEQEEIHHGKKRKKMWTGGTTKCGKYTKEEGIGIEANEGNQEKTRVRKAFSEMHDFSG